MFMSPQIVNKKKYNLKCDIWSWGIWLYYLILGKSPYKSTKIH